MSDEMTDEQAVPAPTQALPYDRIIHEHPFGRMIEEWLDAPEPRRLVLSPRMHGKSALYKALAELRMRERLQKDMQEEILFRTQVRAHE
jgi:hypothetical protein